MLSACAAVRFCIYSMHSPNISNPFVLLTVIRVHTAVNVKCVGCRMLIEIHIHIAVMDARASTFYLFGIYCIITAKMAQNTHTTTEYRFHRKWNWFRLTLDSVDVKCICCQWIREETLTAHKSQTHDLCQSLSHKMTKKIRTKNDYNDTQQKSPFEITVGSIPIRIDDNLCRARGHLFAECATHRRPMKIKE